MLIILIFYSMWAAFQGKSYFFDPYLSPIYSPCLALNCEHVTLRIFGSWWMLSPALLIVWLPIGFRSTCYYYRKAYYRSFWLSPPACAVDEPHKRYTGETRLPLVLQNFHRYFFYLFLINLAFLWMDTVKGFFFSEGLGVGLGSIVLLVMVVLMSLYTFSCHSCRHLLGGNLNLFSKHPLRFRAWKLVSRLNAHHGGIAWLSLIWIPLTDLYIRLLAEGLLTDPRLIL